MFFFFFFSPYHALHHVDDQLRSLIALKPWRTTIVYIVKKQLKTVVDLVLIMFWYVWFWSIVLYCISIYIYTNNQVCPPPLGTTTFATVTSQLGEHSDWRGGCRTCWVVYIYIVHVCMISIYPAQMYTSTLFLSPLIYFDGDSCTFISGDQRRLKRHMHWF